MSRKLKKKLTQIADDLKNEESTHSPTVRELLSWIDAQRRGAGIVQELREALSEAGLTTKPDFESAYIDAQIEFALASEHDSGNVEGDEVAEAPEITNGIDQDSLPSAYTDPTYRLSKLEAANRRPLCVGPDETLECAVTHMLAKDFSQLPVMTGRRDLKGVISWRSIGTRLATGKNSGTLVRDYMDRHVEVLKHSASIFTAMGHIVENDFVLVRAENRTISGIVTASDLSLQFQLLTEPFLLLSEIENHIRRIIAVRFDKSELTDVVAPDDTNREVKGVSDLTFGEYVRFLQTPDNWSRLKVGLDRSVFTTKLDEVRRIRNDVMHFDPDGIPDDDLASLRDFAKLLTTLKSIGIA